MDPSSSPISIIVVDDHHVVREGLAAMLQREPDMEVIAFAATGEEAVEAYRKRPADIVLMDLQLPSMSGVEATRAIRESAPDAAIIVITMYDGDEHIRQALEAGATTYLLKESLFDDLIDVVREVYAGEGRLLPEVKARLDARAAQQRLTPREANVLQLVSEGHRNKEIAAALRMSTETVHVHMRSIFKKLEVHDRTGAVHVALRRGIIHIR